MSPAYKGVLLPEHACKSNLDGEKMETVTDFLFLVSRITAVGDCSHEIRRQLLLGKKAMTNLNSVLKSKDICGGFILIFGKSNTVM